MKNIFLSRMNSNVFKNRFSFLFIFQGFLEIDFKIDLLCKVNEYVCNVYNCISECRNSNI